MIYQFHYPKYNVTQNKILIPHSIYEEYRKMPYSTENQIKKAKLFLKYHTKGMEWFTDKSPLFDAIETGILNCNGICECYVTKLNEDGSMETRVKLNHGNCSAQIILGSKDFPTISSVLSYIKKIQGMPTKFFHGAAVVGTPEDLEKQGYVKRWKPDFIVNEYIKFNEDTSYSIAAYHREHGKIYYYPDTFNKKPKPGEIVDVVGLVEKKILENGK